MRSMNCNQSVNGWRSLLHSSGPFCIKDVLSSHPAVAMSLKMLIVCIETPSQTAHLVRYAGACTHTYIVYIHTHDSLQQPTAGEIGR